MTLVAGQRFKLGDSTWVVVHVNESRAHCKSERREPVTVKNYDWKKDQETVRTFEATSRKTIDISPNSIVEMLDDDAPAEMLRVVPVDEPEPVVRHTTRVADGGWYALEVASTIKPGSRMETVLLHIASHPGLSTQQITEALGKSTDAQIIQDLKRKGLVERR